MSDDKNKDIDSKIDQVLASLKDQNTDEIIASDTNDNIYQNYANILTEISTDPEVAIGSKIGHWTIKKLIGTGGMSIVYLVERNDDLLIQNVALKIIPQGLATKQMIERFIRERQILSDLNHPNIAQLYDVGVTEAGVPWFVMELIEGENILSYSQTHELNIEQKIILFKQVCEALNYAHSNGVVHRDIKPSNLMVTNDKTIKLLDFGIASVDQQNSLTMTGSVIGTPGYMSPEQARGLNDQIDRRSDIFSSGVLLYNLLSGELPFQAETASEISYKIMHHEPKMLGNPIPADLKAITFKCIEKNVDKRYTSFKMLVNDLNAYLSGDVVQARKITVFGRLIKKVKKNPLFSAFIALALLITLIGVGYGVYQSVQSYQKMQLTKEYMGKTESIKNTIRRTHMMPLHNVQPEYTAIKKDIEALRKTIENNKIDNSGLADFALGTAYQNMRQYDQAHTYFKSAEQKGWKSSEMYVGLGEAMAIQWDTQKINARSIVDDKEYEEVIEKAKKEYYQVAIEYLFKAQENSQFKNYLKAKIAVIDGDFEKSIEYLNLDLEQNPWHYESYKLMSYVYHRQFITNGSKEGYDVSFHYYEKSNQALEKAIDIGRSDPSNYVSRCTNVGTEMQLQKMMKYQDFTDAYSSGLKYCKAAIILDPEASTPWANISLLHVTKAEYLESLEKPDVRFYQEALDSLRQGLTIFKDEYKLLIYTIKPLTQLAKNAVSLSQDPMPYYNQAISDSALAQKINNKANKPLTEQARIYSSMSTYYLESLNNLDKSEEYIIKSINAYEQAENIRASFSNKMNIYINKYNLAEIVYKQGKIEKSISLMKESIKGRQAVIPKRSSYFSMFGAVIESQIDLLNTIKKLSQPIDIELKNSIELFNSVCTLEGLSTEQSSQIQEYLTIYTDNHWFIGDNFNPCQK